jgi:NAD(P)-dependent dehydrogenase (short-subunit alcohol dehydrogenase family)
MAEKKIALVTGANRGLGLETSRQLAKKGITVVMGSRDKARGEAAAKKLLKEGLTVVAVQLDVTNSKHIRNVKEYIEHKYAKLDILVNNAGRGHDEESHIGHSVETISPTALHEVLDVNFFGLVELTQVMLPLLRKSDAGRIVNVASIMGSLTVHSSDSGFTDYKPFAYDVSKTAVNQFTIHLAAALKDTPIKVNSAHPGWVRTDMGGKNAPLNVEEGVTTAIRLATLGPDGPTGKFFHNGEELPW